MTLGLCVSPGCMPDAYEVGLLNPPHLRSILYVDHDLDRLAALHRPLFLTLNNEYGRVGSDWSGWEDAVDYVVRRSRDIGAMLLGVSCANELDIYWAQNETDVPPEFAADLVNRAQPILRAAGIPTCTTSVAGPRWVEYLTRMVAHCSPEQVDLHPYGFVWDGLESKLSTFASRANGARLVCSEVGVNISDAGGEEQQAGWLREAAGILDQWGVLGSWFAWHDKNGAPYERGAQAFGLRREDDSARPSWHSYAGLNHATPASEPVIGPGLQSELDRLGWTPTSGEHVTTYPLVWARTPTDKEAVVVWDVDRQEAIPYRRVS